MCLIPALCALGLIWARAPPQQCVAIEDFGNRVRSAHAVIAVPDPHYPPAAAVRLAHAMIDSLHELTAELVLSVATSSR